MASPPISIDLVPWLPKYPAHVTRMQQQRTACGWNDDRVADWVKLQQTGAMLMFWIVLSETQSNGASPPPSQLDELLRQHTTAFPDEAEPLQSDEADGRLFTPVGHLSLMRPLLPGHVPGDAVPAAPPGNPLIVSNVYVSRAVQGIKVGRLAMDALEAVARGERGAEWKAGELMLYTVEGAAQKDTARHEALGRKEMPKVTLQEWYERRGYVLCERVEGRFDKTDASGKVWPAAMVVMKLDLE